MRARVLTMVALALTLAVSACTTSSAGSDPADPNQVEVLTWMTSASERDAFDALTSVFADKHPDIELIDASIAGGHDSAADAIESRLESGAPPDTMQVRAGADLHQYAARGELVDLAPLFDEEGFDSALPSELIDQLSVDGRIFAIPAVVQRANVLWTNSAALERAGIVPSSPAAGVDEWIRDLERVRDSGVAFPLAVGGPQQQLALFENVLLAELGYERYLTLWNGGTRFDAGRVTRAVATFERFLSFADPSLSRATEQDVLTALVAGDAAYYVGPGLTDGVLRALGWELGPDYSATAVPGTAGVFLYAADAFALPVDASHPDAARDWLRTVGSAEGQRALSVVAGSIPLRDGVDVSTPYQRAAQVSLNFGALAPSLSLGTAADREWTQAIAEAVAEFRSDGRDGALLRSLADAADSALQSIDG